MSSSTPASETLTSGATVFARQKAKVQRFVDSNDDDDDGGAADAM